MKGSSGDTLAHTFRCGEAGCFWENSQALRSQRGGLGRHVLDKGVSVPEAEAKLRAAASSVNGGRSHKPKKSSYLAPRLFIVQAFFWPFVQL